MSLVRKRCVVQGRVQGVFFRASTQQKAQQLGLSGWAKNCTDGSVEVVAVGPAADVRLLQVWLKEGPPHARVASLECKELSASADVPDGFLIL